MINLNKGIGHTIGDTMLKSYRWGGGLCDFSVSPSPFGLDFGTLDLGLTIKGLAQADTLINLNKGIGPGR